MDPQITCRLCLSAKTQPEHLVGIGKYRNVITDVLSLPSTSPSWFESNICTSCVKYLTDFIEYKHRVTQNQVLWIDTTVAKNKEVVVTKTEAESLPPKRLLRSSFKKETKKRIPECEEEEEKNVNADVTESELELANDQVPSPERARSKEQLPDDRHQLDVHMREMNILTCHVCGAAESSFAALAGHIRQAHGPNTARQVTCCETKFYKGTRLYDHMRFHLNGEAFKCADCGKCFSNSKVLQSHSHIHAPKELCPFACDNCEKRFKTRGRYEIHIRRHLGNEARVHKCANCPKAFKDVYTLKEHVRRVHKRIRPHICAVCGATFADKQNMLNHYDFKHDPGRKKEPCDVCGMYLWNVDKHKKRVHVTHTRVKCDKCEHTFSRRKLLLNHIRKIHVHGPQSCPCTICGKVFGTKKRLLEHLSTHSGIKLYTCYFCSKTFSSTGNRIKHLRNMHKADYEAWRLSRYQPPDEGTNKVA